MPSVPASLTVRASGVVAALSVVAAGCHAGARAGSAAPVVLTSYQGLPQPLHVVRVRAGMMTPSANAAAVPGPSVLWIDGGSRLAVTLWGGGCTRYPDQVRVLDAHRVQIRLQSIAAKAICTEQLNAVTSELAAPPGLDPVVAAHVLLDGHDLVLPAVH